MVYQGFYALLGSVNGTSSMRMLIEHKEALGFLSDGRTSRGLEKGNAGRD